VRVARFLIALAVACGLAGSAQAQTAVPAGDWFVLTVTAGPQGAENWDAAFSIAGKRTGQPIVHGAAIAGAERTEGKVTTGLGSSLILGASAGPVQMREEALPVEGDAFGLKVTASGSRLAPGATVHVLSFASGTTAQASDMAASAKTGSVIASMTSGNGSQALLLIDGEDGAAVELAATGAGVGQGYSVDSPGLVGGFVSCISCSPTWKAPDGRSGGEGVFSGPSGRWALAWSGVVDPQTGRASVGGYAPIGSLWRHFNFGSGTS
jgi:hypothetical protein